MIPNLQKTTDNIQYAIDMTNKYGSRRLASFAISDMIDAALMMASGSFIGELNSVQFFLDGKPECTRRYILPEHEEMLKHLNTLPE